MSPIEAADALRVAEITKGQHRAKVEARFDASVLALLSEPRGRTGGPRLVMMSVPGRTMGHVGKDRESVSPGGAAA